MLQVAEVYGGDFSVGDHKNRKVERKKLPVMEVQCEARLMERGLWGFTLQGQETPPAAVRNAFWLRSDKAYSLIALE